jgi:hypothetical protein
MLVENDACLLQLSCYVHRNPLRAGLVQRLVDFRWSSYRVYAHRQKPVGWLATGLILNVWRSRRPAWRSPTGGPHISDSFESANAVLIAFRV